MNKFNVKPFPLRNYKRTLYTKVKGKKGIWYFPADLDDATEIYLFDPSGKVRGFGGNVLSFKMLDGTTEKLKGPSHSNSNALFRDTKIDLRNEHLTRGVLALSSNYDLKTGDITFDSVLYKDEKWVLGTFNRIQMMAQDKANKMGCNVYYYSQSMNGSVRSFKEPKKAKVIKKKTTKKRRVKKTITQKSNA